MEHTTASTSRMRPTRGSRSFLIQASSILGSGHYRVVGTVWRGIKCPRLRCSQLGPEKRLEARHEEVPQGWRNPDSVRGVTTIRRHALTEPAFSSVYFSMQLDLFDVEVRTSVHAGLFRVSLDCSFSVSRLPGLLCGVVHDAGGGSGIAAAGVGFSEVPYFLEVFRGADSRHFGIFGPSIRDCVPGDVVHTTTLVPSRGSPTWRCTQPSARAKSPAQGRGVSRCSPAGATQAPSPSCRNYVEYVTQ